MFPIQNKFAYLESLLKISLFRASMREAIAFTFFVATYSSPHFWSRKR